MTSYIYSVSTGCVHEGGSIALSATSFKKAILFAREEVKEIQAENMALKDGGSALGRRWMDSYIPRLTKTDEDGYWEIMWTIGIDYVKIRRFRDD